MGGTYWRGDLPALPPGSAPRGTGPALAPAAASMNRTEAIRTMILVVVAGCGGATGSGSTSDGGIADSPSGDAWTSGEGGADGGTMDSSPGDASGGGAEGSCPFTDGGAYDGGPSPSRVPMNHRPAGASCPRQRGPVTPDASACGAPDGGGCGVCASDSDCTAGPNGRCYTGGGAGHSSCSYDECFGDSDCEGGAPCDCRASSSSLTANSCRTASNCTVDSDCGPGGYCSPSVPAGFCSCLSTALCGDSGSSCTANGVSVPCDCGDSCGHGYFCHTRCDECVDDSDCGDQETCNYDTLSDRWDCSECLGFP